MWLPNNQLRQGDKVHNTSTNQSGSWPTNRVCGQVFPKPVPGIRENETGVPINKQSPLPWVLHAKLLFCWWSKWKGNWQEWNSWESLPNCGSKQTRVLVWWWWFQTLKRVCASVWTWHNLIKVCVEKGIYYLQWSRLAQLGSAKFFSKLDTNTGFWEVPLLWRILLQLWNRNA